MRWILLFGLAGCASLEPMADASSPAAKAEAPASKPTPLHEQTLTRLDGSTLSGADLKGKAVLVVNVASKCGFTPQYEGLQQLYTTYKDRGLEVVGVPCNQFGGQEPGSAETIEEFCRVNYGVGFTILEKQKVNGAERSPLYDFLVGSDAGGGQNIKWNFEKFLVNADGEVVGRWGSRTKPDDAELVAAIDKALRAVE